MPTIEILLATYNGEQFLEEQIDSLLEQTYQNIMIVARDDGSQDSTREILQLYAEKQPGKFTVLPASQPTGAPQLNFLHLMQASSASFIMFSDQDDVWDVDKVAVSIKQMKNMISTHGNDKPLLVFSDLMVVDEDLSVISPSFWKDTHLRPNAVQDLSSLLRQNVVTGNTMLINRPLLNLALSMTSDSIMHDWWIALAANSFGHASYLARTTTKYRQHSSNAIGAGEKTAPHTLLPRFEDRAGWAKEWAHVYTMAAAFLRAYGTMLPLAKSSVFQDVIRCTESRSSVERLFRMAKRQYFRYGLRANVAMLLHLWKNDFVKEAIMISRARSGPKARSYQESRHALGQAYETQELL
ncbi:MAG: glycosyltransferase family 2 protein [Janthinobacterium lividum]